MGKNICGGCNEIFGGLSSFDKHRVGSYGEPVYKNEKGRDLVRYAKHTRRCLTPEEMLALGMRRNEKGWWIEKEMPSGLWSKRQDDDEQDADEIEEESA
jgi:hypothetical protein